MPRVKQAPSQGAEVLASFRTEVMEVYKRFEEDLVAVSKKYGFAINMWYSPSRIPQPNFKAGRLLLDVDQLYHEQDFKEFIVQHSPMWNSTTSASSLTSTSVGADLFQKNVELRRGADLSYSTAFFDFGQDDSDLRVRRSRTRRGKDF